LWRANGSEGDYWYTSVRDAVAELRGRHAGQSTVGLCGPGPAQVNANWQTDDRLPINRHAEEHVGYVYAAPSVNTCRWDSIRALERARPVLVRAERGGGLVWELLGPADGAPHPELSPLTYYDAW